MNPSNQWGEGGGGKGRDTGVKGAGSLREMGEERVGRGILKVVETRGNRKTYHNAG